MTQISARLDCVENLTRQRHDSDWLAKLVTCEKRAPFSFCLVKYSRAKLHKIRVNASAVKSRSDHKLENAHFSRLKELSPEAIVTFLDTFSRAWRLSHVFFSSCD